MLAIIAQAVAAVILRTKYPKGQFLVVVNRHNSSPNWIGGVLHARGRLLPFPCVDMVLLTVGVEPTKPAATSWAMHVAKTRAYLTASEPLDYVSRELRRKETEAWLDGLTPKPAAPEPDPDFDPAADLPPHVLRAARDPSTPVIVLTPDMGEITFGPGFRVNE